MASEGLWDWLDRFRTHPRLAALLIAINLGGVAYGFYYYGLQFALTPAWLWPWVPDSPLAVGFFAASLALHGLGRGNQLMDWLAFVANVKVGLWTAYVLLHYDAAFHIFQEPLGNLNFWLFWLHLAMAVQAFVLARSLRLSLGGAAAGAWLLLDVAMDYGLAPITLRGCTGTMPITVPCQDVRLLLGVTLGLWALGAGLGALLAWRVGPRAQGAPAPP